MEFLQDINLFTVLLVFLGLGVVWFILRPLLRMTARVFTCGCLGLLVVGAAAWAVYTFVL